MWWLFAPEKQPRPVPSSPSLPPPEPSLRFAQPCENNNHNLCRNRQNRGAVTAKTAVPDPPHPNFFFSQATSFFFADSHPRPKNVSTPYSHLRLWRRPRKIHRPSTGARSGRGRRLRPPHQEAARRRGLRVQSRGLGVQSRGLGVEF